MPHIVARAALGVTLAALLPSCFGAPQQARAVAPPIILTYQAPLDRGDGHQPPIVASPDPGSVATLDRGSVSIRGFKEPGDWGHRNYCGAGAVQVLVSAWLKDVPDIETVARRANLDPKSGIFGIDATYAINSFLEPVVMPALGHARYQAEHVSTLEGVKTRIRQDLLDAEAIKKFGHGVPVIVQAMTRTMPGWNRWNATHMFTIFAFDFTRNDPALDTVTYAETPSPVAGYRGPDFQTISLNALWTAMDEYNVQFPQDPLNVIY